jgi:dipeptidase
VAKKVPDGHIHGHANQARITELIEGDPDMMWSEDVIDFAIEHGVSYLTSY